MKKQVLLGIIVLLLIGFTLPLTVFLVKLRQEIRRKAQEPTCFTEEFDYTTYKDVAATTADWNTYLSRLQLKKEEGGRHYFPRVATDGTNSYVAYMSSEDGVRVAKFDPAGQPVLQFGGNGVSDPVSSYWAMQPVYDIVVSPDGGAYVLYHGKGLLQRLDRVTGKPFWVVENPESPCLEFTTPAECEENMCYWYDGSCYLNNPTAPHTLLSGFHGCTGEGWTMTVDNNSHVYVGGGCDTGISTGYYITKMKNGGERAEEKRKKVLDIVPQYDDIDLVASGNYLYLAWEEGRSCFVQKYDNNTLVEKWSSPLEISQCYGYMSIAAEPGGNFYLLSHKSEDAGDLELRKYNGNKNYLWGPTTLNGNLFKCSLYFNAGQLYAAWRDFSDPQPSNWIQRFNTSNGSKLFGDKGLLLVSPAGPEAYLNANGPLVTVDDDGNAIAAYVEWGIPDYFVEVTKVPPGATSEDDFIFQVSPSTVDMHYISPGRGQSVTVASTTTDIISATLTADQVLNGGNISYYLSADGGTHWEGPVSLGIEWTFANPSKSLKWRADLSTPDTSKTPWVDSLTICYKLVIPTATPSPSATTTPSPTPTATLSPTPTSTITPSPSPSITPTITLTPTPSASPTPTITPTSSPSPSPTPTLEVTPTPTGTPTLTLTPTPTIPSCEGECLEIVAFNENWEKINDPNTIFVGQSVHFAVRGTTDCPSGFTKGRFRINQTASSDWCTGPGNAIVNNWCETTDKHDEYYYVTYVVPSAGSYKVEAMVYCPDIGEWK